MSQTADKPMTKSQLLAAISEKTGVSKQHVSAVVDELVNIAYSEAKTKEKGFTVPGLGKLMLVNRAARSGRNPATGETIQIPAKKVVKFRIAKVAKDSILG